MKHATRQERSKLIAPWIVAAGLLFTALAACGGDGTPATPPPAVAIGGDVQTPASLTAADLKKQTAIAQTVTYNAGTTPQTHAYTGASLWSVLNAASIKTDPAIKNDIINKYVTATGSDGYLVVFSAGEIDPDFGNRASLIAYSETINGAAGDLPTGDGPFRVTAPGDIKGGRYVSMLTNVNIHASASTVRATDSLPSATFTISGKVKNPGTFDLAKLQAMPASSATLSGSAYTGVDLWYLLNTAAGLDVSASAKNPSLSMYVVATGSDGYKALVSLGEIDPGFGAKQDLIAYSTSDGTALGSSGAFRLVIPGETKAGRSVSNLISLEVFAVAAP